MCARSCAGRCLFIAFHFSILNALCCTQPATRTHVSVESTPVLAANEPADKSRMRLEDIGEAPAFPDRKGAPPLAATDINPQARRHLERGRKRFDDGHWTDAMSALERAILIEPSLIEARLLLARSAMRLGHSTPAREQLDAVLERDPRNLTAHRLLGDIAIHEQKPRDAIAAYRRVLAAAPQDSTATDVALTHIALAQVLNEGGYLSAAADQYERYLAAEDKLNAAPKPDAELAEAFALYRGRAAAALGDIYTALNEHDRAETAYHRAAAQNPDDAGLSRRRILAMARAGKTDDALLAVRAWKPGAEAGGGRIELLREVCEIANRPDRYDAELARLAEGTNDSATSMALARLLLSRGSAAEAAELLERIDAGDKGIEQAQIMLIEIYADMGKADRALHAAANVVRRRPAAFDRVSTIIAEGNSADAFTTEARATVEKHPDDAVAQLLFGRMLMRRGDDAEALDALRTAIRLDASLEPAHAAMAECHCALKQWEDAISSAQSAVDKGVKSWAVHMALGKALAAMDNDASAEEAFLAAFELDKSNAEPLFRIAEMAERRGQGRRAEQLYRRILDDVDPRHVKARERMVVHYLNRGEIDRSRAYFSDFAELGLKGPPVERCRAMLALTTSGATTAQERLNEYLAALRKILDAHPGDWETHLEIARSHAAVNDFDAALKETDLALAVAPDELASREMKAMYLTKLLRFDEASEVVRGLLVDRPRDLGYLQDLLRIADSRGDWDTAATLLRDFLKRDDLKEQHALFTSMLINALSHTRKWDEAIDVAKQWLDDSPEDIVRRSTYLVTLGRAERHDQAIAAAEDFLKTNASSRVLQIELLRRLQDAKRHTEAIQRTLVWLADAADDIDLNVALIRLCWSSSRWDEAIEIARINAERSQSRTTFESLLGETYRLAKRYDEAIQLYRDRVAAAQKRRRNIENDLRAGVDRAREQGLLLALRESISEARTANFALIGLLIAAERYDQAERQVNKLLQPEMEARDNGQPFDAALIVDLRGFLSEIYQDTNQHYQAIQQLEAVYEMDPNDPGINNNLGYSLTEAGRDLERAEKMIRFSLAQNPRSHATLDSLGWVLYKRGKFDEAVQYIRQALRLSEGEEPVLHDHLGDALYRMGNKAAAADEWRKALEMCNPNQDLPLNRDRRILHDALKAKLGAFEKGEDVATAPIQSEMSIDEPDPKSTTKPQNGDESHAESRDKTKSAP